MAQVSDGDLADATAAFATWRRTPPPERSVILHRAFELRHRDVDRLATLMVSENGTSLSDARGEAVYAAEFSQPAGALAVGLRRSPGTAGSGRGGTSEHHRSPRLGTPTGSEQG